MIKCLSNGRYRWGGRGSSRNPCQEIYGGSGPFSEPETASVQKFITSNSGANWKAYVSFHSYGQYILFPWGYDRVVPPDYKDLETVGRKAAMVSSPRYVKLTTNTQTGQLKNNSLKPFSATGLNHRSTEIPISY